MSCCGDEQIIPDFFRGDTLPITLEFSDPNTGGQLDITGYIITVTFKSSESDSDLAAVLQKSVTATGADALEGKVVVPFTSDDTDIPTGTYFVDIQRVIATDPPDVWTLLKQKVQVKQDITLTDE